MLHNNQQECHEAIQIKRKSKVRRKKSKPFENLHPSIKECIEKLNDLYSNLLSSLTYEQENPFSIFNPKIVAKTLAETHRVAVDTFIAKPDEWDIKQRKYLGDLEELYLRTLDRLQGGNVEPIIVPQGADKRFKSPEWTEFPVFDYLKQSYLLHCKYLRESVEALEGIDSKTKEKIQFYVGSLMDAISPTNLPFTNPEVLKETIRTNGQNLVRGCKKFLEDRASSNFLNLPMFTNLKAFEVGKNLATTEGKVVYETTLFQLIHYKPETKLVYERPLLMIPPWINKYYIFDLQKENSFVSWALEKGFSVFVLSWINPDKTYANFSLSDYVMEGILEAIKKVLSISKQEQLNLLAYCTGGVAASLLAGYLAEQTGRSPIASLSLLAVPIDFDKMGDLKIFICKDQLKFQEQRINKIGYFPGNEMVRVFSFLRANDLIWSNYINAYLLNKEALSLDFLYWNCDTTNIPAKLHIEYLKQIFLKNALMHEGKFKVNNVKVDLKKIKIPIFAFATKSDHIVPWESAYAIKRLCPGNTTFVLGAAGHVAGIINPPNQGKYCYWKSEGTISNPTEWFENAEEVPGSWWPEWYKWVKSYTGKKVKTTMWNHSKNIEPAPGRYVLSTSPRDNF